MEPKLPKKDKIFVGKIYYKVDGPSIQEIIKIQPFNHKLWKNLFSEVGQYNFTAAKKAFFTVSWHKTIFCHENDKPSWQTTYTIWKLGSRRVFWAWVLGYHHIQITGLEFLQRCGHQIRVNIWTGSYVEWSPLSGIFTELAPRLIQSISRNVHLSVCCLSAPLPHFP